MVYIYTMKEIVRNQIEECISEISRYSTVWSGKRVIIYPTNYNKRITITVDKATEDFSYNEIEKATNYVINKL